MTTATGFSFGASFFFSPESADELQAVSRPATRARARMRFTLVLLTCGTLFWRGAGFQPVFARQAESLPHGVETAFASKPHSDGECKGLLTLHAAEVTIKHFEPPPARADGRTPGKARRMTTPDEDIYLDVETDWGRRLTVVGFFAATTGLV